MPQVTLFRHHASEDLTPDRHEENACNQGWGKCEDIVGFPLLWTIIVE